MINQYQLMVTTKGRGFKDLTRDISKFVLEAKAETGLCNVFLHHTSASLIICENADELVRVDLEEFISQLIPDGDKRIYKHDQEGHDDMPAHIRTILTQNSLTIPITHH